MAEPLAAIGGNGDLTDTLLVVFLRGAADGLTLVPPIEDDNYYRARPRIATAKKDAVILDSLFGLHPLLAPLKPVYAEGHLAILHAAGSEDDTHSHFDAQDLMEHGGGVTAGGWLGKAGGGVRSNEFARPDRQHQLIQYPRRRRSSGQAQRARRALRRSWR